MSNLFDIGKSALQSYQQALAVTGQNIANINTDGYKRRDIDLEEVSAGRNGVTASSLQTGLGVRTDGIRRSFNEFLLNKARSANAYAETTSKYVDALAQTENILLPGDTGLDKAMTDFFNVMQDVAAAPADRVPRTMFIQSGERLVESFKQTSSLLDVELDSIKQQITNDIESLNALTAELANLNQLISSGGKENASNALLDTRDGIIDNLSNFVEVSVKLENTGTATVTLGNSGMGPVLVEGMNRAVMGAEAGDVTLSFLLAIGLSETPTSRVTNGSVRGYADAFDRLTQTQTQLDQLAFIMANQLNEVHQNGLDLNGDRGGVLFLNASLEVSPNPNNRGSVIPELVITDASKLGAEDIFISFNEEANKWTAYDEKQNILAAGRQSIELSGARLTFAGTARDGDNLTLKPKSGQASSLSFAITNPSQIAAASQQLVYSTASNKGNAELQIKAAAPPDYAHIPNVQDSFSNGFSAIGATDFLRDEAVAIIPPSVSAIDILSLSVQPQLKFSVTGDELAGLKTLNFGIELAGGSNQNWNFDLQYSTLNAAIGSWQDASDVADMLNQGILRGTNGVDLDNNGNLKTFSLADIGIFASGDGGRLTLARAGSRDFLSGANLQFANSNARPAIQQLAKSTPSDIQILTREGRHIAGAALSSDQITALITKDNGFADGAVYNADYLNISGTNGYLGVGIERTTSAAQRLAPITGTTDTKTVTFERLQGVDDASGAPGGQNATAEIMEYTTTIAGVSKTITPADVASNEAANIAQATADAFRKEAPIATMSGAASLLSTTLITLTQEQNTKLANNNRVSLTHNDIGYLVERTDTGLTVTGGHANATSLTMVGSVISTKIPNLPAEGDIVAVDFEGSRYTLTYTKGEIEVAGGEAGRLVAYFDANYRLQIRSATGTLSGASISLPDDAVLAGNSAAAEKFGLTSGLTSPTTQLNSQSNSFVATDFDIKIANNQLVATHKVAGTSLAVSTSADSLVGQSVRLSDLPNEDLIILLSGNGARRLTTNFDIAPQSAPQLAANITINLTDASAGSLNFVDKDTGTIMATRTLDADKKVSALGFDIQLSGAGQDGDSFEISNNASGSGDARNIRDLYDLRNIAVSPELGGSFHEIFNRTVTDLGTAIQSGRLSSDAAKALKDASLEAEASFSGVNLDVEASNLIQQQQAYQASARILSTARDMFQTLIDVV